MSIVVVQSPVSVHLSAKDYVGAVLMFVGSQDVFFIPDLCPVMSYQFEAQAAGMPELFCRPLPAAHGFTAWCRDNAVDLERQAGPYYRVCPRTDDDALALRMRWR